MDSQCSVCGHDDGVHFFFAGCCGVTGCPCRGTDGADNCRRAEHGKDCWSFTLRAPVPAASKLQAEHIWNLHQLGHGTRTIARDLGVKRPIVQKVLRGEIWPEFHDTRAPVSA